jgi:hypothetical protein
VTAGKGGWCVKFVFKEFIAIERTAVGGSLQRLVRLHGLPFDRFVTTSILHWFSSS